MIILVDRYLSTNEATLSRVYVDGVHLVFGLEDEWREVKVPGETRIPAGIYKIRLRTFGEHHVKYSKDRRFRSFHQGMLWLQNVPGFDAILIHVGNYERDTKGCLLVGLERNETQMTLSRSGEGYSLLYNKVVDAASHDHLMIELRDSDR